MHFDRGTKSLAREQLREGLTELMERRRAHYHRLKAADTEITRAELSEARVAYEHALVFLSQLVENSSKMSQRLR